MFLTVSSFAQKTLSEGTIVYDVVVNTGNKEPQMTDALDGATTTVYLKGSKSRTDMVSALGTESNIYDSKTGNAIILKEYSSQKLMITLTKENWETKNKAYSNVRFEFLPETKEINGYSCKKAIAKMSNGKTFNVYYTTDVVVYNKEYNYTFIDRKSEGDFLGTLASGVERFEREIQRTVELEGYLFVVIETSIDSIIDNHKKFKRKTNLEYVFHNLRDLTHKYPRHLQFIFTGSRKRSIDLIPRLLYFGKDLWQVDLQYFLDHELGNR